MAINYEHRKLIKALVSLDQVPTDASAFSEWIKAGKHLAFLRQNFREEEIVVHASSDYALIHSIVVPNDELATISRGELMDLDIEPYKPIASYETGGQIGQVWIERGWGGTESEMLRNAVQLIFCREFEGHSKLDKTYYELYQEYAHLANIYWVPERQAYCRYNEHGDLEEVVSVTTPDGKQSTIALASFKWKTLEEYLAASNASLVRMFDFTLLRRSGFSGWSNEPPEEFAESKYLFYRQRVMSGHAANTRGVQIIRPRRPREVVFAEITNGWFGPRSKQYVEFIAFDWRNEQIVKISTDPKATTNYFNAKQNSLPYELSPAFFRSEVLSKYKTDREKYTLGERFISCRSAWYLQRIDVNEAGQVHAYIRDLRSLPYEEQLYWLSFNEEPKAGLSERAVIHDFEGKFITLIGPREKLLSIVRRWHCQQLKWWSLRNEKLLEQANTPLTASREEWGEAFMDLAKLIVEGFETKPIRELLDKMMVPYDKEKDKTITLLEKLANKVNSSDEVQQLIGLRTLQRLRSKVKGHVGGSDADQLAQNALMEHGTFASHFHYVCSQVTNELEMIETILSDGSRIESIRGGQ